MNLARQVTVIVQGSGAFPMRVGDQIRDKTITSIEVYHNDYEDHTELSVLFLAGKEIVRRLWNVPVDVLYEDAYEKASA